MTTRSGYGRLRGVLAGVAAVAMVGALAACSAPDGKPAEQVLVVGQTVAPNDNFNPYNLKPGNDVGMYQLYDSLLRTTADGSDPIPRLAESWKVADDGLSIALKLRQATFADGSPITSADVALSLAWVQDTANGANMAPLAARVTSIDTPSDLDVVMHFDKPFPGVFDMLNLLLIVDQGTIDSDFAKPNASGPFTLSDYDPEVGYTLSANPKFWDGAPKLKTIDVKIIANAETAMSALRSGDIDYVQQVTAFDYNTLKGDDKFVTGLAGGANSVVSLLINVTDPALSNPDVRQALSYALDRDRIVKDVQYGSAVPACLPFNTPGQLGYDKDQAATCTFDLKKASALLKKAGVTDLSFSLVASGQVSAVLPKIAEIFQADLATIGVKVDIQDLDAAAYQEQTGKALFPQTLVQFVGRGNLDPSTLFGATKAWQPKNNESHFDDADYTQLVNAAGSTFDAAERADLYGQLNKLILEQNFVLPIATNPKPFAAAAGVSGVSSAPNGQPYFESVVIG